MKHTTREREREREGKKRTATKGEKKNVNNRTI